WMLSGAALPTWTLLVLGGFGPLFAALYPLTQLYQVEEDRARGDRTLALLLGTRASLLFAIGMVIAAFGMMASGLLDSASARWTGLLVVPAVAWLALLLRWLRRHPTMSTAQSKQGMYKALSAWALTDAVVLAAALLANTN